MSKKNTNVTTTSTINATTVTMTAAEFKQKSYDAYLAYVAFIEGKKSILETVEALSPLMSAYGFALTVDNLANLLTVKMTAYGKDKGEQAKKVKSISTFRAFVKGEEGMRENWFTTDICGGDCDDPCAFDVRDLSTYAADIPYEQIICEAIDKGELKQETPLKEREA